MKARTMLGIFGPIVFAIACAQSDPGITTKVKSQLIADDLVKARNIDVDTRDGVVTLTGTVQSRAEQDKALQIARNTKGVARVVDNLALAPEPGAAPTTGEIIGDTGITASVKTRLLADPDVSGLRIEVDTNKGVVTLTGDVGSAREKARAIEIAGKVDNVKRVEDRLTVRPR